MSIYVKMCGNEGRPSLISGLASVVIMHLGTGREEKGLTLLYKRMTGIKVGQQCEC
jgi:hypothetical protein